MCFDYCSNVGVALLLSLLLDPTLIASVQVEMLLNDSAN